MTTIRHTIRELSAAGDVFTSPVRVESVRPISSGLVRIRVSGAGLSAYTDPRSADAFKLAIPVVGGTAEFPGRRTDRLPVWGDGPRPVLRAFTVRAVAPDRTWLDFDAWRHGDGYFTGWLRSATAGDEIGLSGMRREFHPGDGVDRHLLVGDACALPAIITIAESLPAGMPVTAVIGVADASDRELLAGRPGLDVHWVSDSAPAGAGSVLADAVVRSLPEPTGERIQAWIGAEAGVVREVRRHVLDRLGVHRDDLHAAAYWKAGEDSTARDAVLLSTYQRLVADGGSATDPDSREFADLDAS